MPEKKENKRNITVTEKQADGSIRTTSYNIPLAKNGAKVQKSAIRPINIAGKQQKSAPNRIRKTEQAEFFDATLDDETTPARDIQKEIEQAKKRALQEHQILENYRNNPPKKDITYSSCAIGSIVTVAILLALTLVFFLWLKWYGVGLGFAVLTIIASQIWIMFLKKINKKYDALEKATDADEIALQEHLKEKYPAIYEAQQENDKKSKKNKSTKSKSYEHQASENTPTQAENNQKQTKNQEKQQKITKNREKS